jgi:hypothetical protein
MQATGMALFASTTINILPALLAVCNRSLPLSTVEIHIAKKD